MVGTRKITILMLQDSMWQGGEEFDQPGDFDEGAGQEWGAKTQIQTQESRQSVTVSNNIHITVNVNGVGAESRRDPIFNLEAMNSTEWAGIEANKTEVDEQGDESAGILKSMMDAVQEMIQKETEKTGQRREENSTVYVVVGIVVGCLICVIGICIYLCYR